MTQPAPSFSTQLDAITEREELWHVVVLDDPYTLMTYVVWVLQQYFKFSKDKATRLMLTVHNNGRAVVATGPHAKAEQDAIALQVYGLRAIIAPVGEGDADA